MLKRPAAQLLQAASKVEPPTSTKVPLGQGLEHPKRTKNQEYATGQDFAAMRNIKSERKRSRTSTWPRCPRSSCLRGRAALSRQPLGSRSLRGIPVAPARRSTDGSHFPRGHRVAAQHWSRTPQHWLLKQHCWKIVECHHKIKRKAVTVLMPMEEDKTRSPRTLDRIRATTCSRCHTSD